MQLQCRHSLVVNKEVDEYKRGFKFSFSIKHSQEEEEEKSFTKSKLIKMKIFIVLAIVAGKD